MTELHRIVIDLARQVASRLKQAEKFHQLGLGMHEVRSAISTWYAGACSESCLDRGSY
jgi:hypothetical protein